MTLNSVAIWWVVKWAIIVISFVGVPEVCWNLLCIIVEKSRHNLAILDGDVTNRHIPWVVLVFSLTFEAFLIKLIDNVGEIAIIPVSWVVPYEILIHAIVSFSSFQNDVLDLGPNVMCLFVNIKADPWFWIHVRIHALHSTWNLTVNIKINMVIPWKTEADRLIIGNLSTCIKNPLFGNIPLPVCKELRWGDIEVAGILHELIIVLVDSNGFFVLSHHRSFLLHPCFLGIWFVAEKHQTSTALLSFGLLDENVLFVDYAKSVSKEIKHVLNRDCARALVQQQSSLMRLLSDLLEEVSTWWIDVNLLHCSLQKRNVYFINCSISFETHIYTHSNQRLICSPNISGK